MPTLKKLNHSEVADVKHDSGLLIKTSIFHHKNKTFKLVCTLILRTTDRSK